jgi:enediyne biosynthesis protein E8
MPSDVNRRTLLQSFVAAAAAATGALARPASAAGAPSTGAAAVPTVPSIAALDSSTTATFEAFSDTIVPGAKRSAGDVAIAGATTGPGAVQAGAIALFTMPALGLAELLPATAVLLNARATAYAVLHLIWLPWDRPPFVGLPFNHRTALVRQLVAPAAADRLLWLSMAFIAGLAFDAAAHQDTATAVRAGHPGLAWLAFPAPDADGLWRFPAHSYGSALAAPHPGTTASGSPS